MRGAILQCPGPVTQIVSFPKAGAVNGTLVLAEGDINLTFKRYLATPVRLAIANDYVTAIDGGGTDAVLMRRYLAAWGEPEAYAVSHVGFGLNRRARYEALTMYDRRDTNDQPRVVVLPAAPTGRGSILARQRASGGHFASSRAARRSRRPNSRRRSAH